MSQRISDEKLMAVCLPIIRDMSKDGQVPKWSLLAKKSGLSVRQVKRRLNGLGINRTESFVIGMPVVPDSVKS
jgi:hypothetical protein